MFRVPPRLLPSRLLTRRAAHRVASPGRARLSVAAVVTVLAVTLGGFAASPALAAADTKAPSNPGSLSASYFGGVGAVVTWGKVSASDLDVYRVYRSTSKTVVANSSNLVGSTTSLKFTDSALAGGAVVYYAVTAVDKAGNESKLSSVKSVTASDTKKPDAPSKLKATASASGISLDWADNDEPDLRGYVVERSSTSKGPFVALSGSPVTTSALLDGEAPAGAKAYYRVSAVDLSGNASSTATTSASRPAGPPSVPAAPTGFTGSAASDGAVTLSWSASAGATSYVVSRGTSASGPYERISTSTLTATSFSDKTAPIGATAYYTVVAVNGLGTSGAASTSVAVPADTTPPTAPSSPKVVVVAGGGMTASWKASKESDVAGYVVYRRNASEVYERFLPLDGAAALPATSFTDPAATEGTTTYYRVRAIDRAGNESKNYLAITAKNPNVAPAAPSGFTVRQNTVAGLDLAWAAPKDLDVAGYAISRSATSNGTFVLLTNVTASSAGTPPRFTDTSAPKGVTVYYRITAVDLVGNVSKNSSTVSGTSLTAPVPIPVEETVLTVGADKEFATIGAALATVPDGSLRRYRLDIDPGTYDEVLAISESNVTLQGLGGDSSAVVIRAAQASGTTDPDEPESTLGTAGSAVVYVTGTDVTLRGLTVVNAFDEKANPQITSAQAVALRVEGDRFVADTVRLLGNQDTLLADTPKPTTRIRQYYVNSYIEGDVDYVFGAGTAVFDRVTFRSLDRGKSNNGYLTAASTDKGSKYGFLITDSKIVSDAAAGTINLGRPWHPSADPDALGSVVVKNTWLPAAIDTAQPWDDMASTNSSGVKVNFSWTGARFSEFGNTGPGATVNANRPQLSAKDAANATPEKYLAGKDGWNPVLPTVAVVPAAPTGLVAAADTRVVHLTWNDDVSAATVGWTVWRSTSGGVAEKIAQTSSPTYSDTTVTNGVRYSYTVTADTRAGVSSAPSAPADVLVEAAPLVVDITVDPGAAENGTTVFRTLGAALAAAPAGSATNPTVIQLAAGRYAEYDVVDKPYLVLVGATGSAQDVVITGNRAAGTPTGTTTDGVADTFGTSGSATLVVTASNVQLRDLTVENSYVEGTYANGQAVALRTTGDRIVLERVRLLGNQDTFYANTPNTATAARVYVHDSWIEGDVDFVFGRATVVIDRSTLKALDHGTSPNGAVTAASTDKGQNYGFLITGSRIIGTAPDGSQNLGRPWQPGQRQADGTSVADTNAIAQVVVRDSWLGPVVSQANTWTDMTNSGVVTSWKSARFAEYGNTGPGAGVSATRPQLSDADAATFTAANYLAGADGWNPVADTTADAAPAGVAGLVATGDDKQVGLTWNDNAESDAVTYRVYRSAGSDAVAVTPAQLVAEVAKPAYLDRGLVNGTAYHYLVVAVDRAGNVSSAGSAVDAIPNIAPLVADITVAADGSGDVTTVQAALNAITAGTSAKPKVVLVKPGTYREVVISTKANVVIAGTTGDPNDVVISFDNANGTVKSATTCPAVTAATCGTAGSATVTLSGSGVQVRDLTIANTFDKNAHPEIGNYNTQAVALRATGDRQVYDNVRLLGVQDTLNADAAGNISANGAGYPRQYYVNSYIEGNVDFVFGRATAVFDRVTFFASAHNGGTVFAPSTASKSNGYLVVDSRIASANDPGSFALGRPWRAWSDGAYADNSRGETVIRNTWIAAGFDTNQPWVDFAPNVWTDGRFAEYGNTGPGATASANRPQLSADQAAARTAGAYLAGTDGWSPVRDAKPSAAPLAPAGLVAGVGSGQIALTWQENTESDVRAYRVYRDGTLVGETAGNGFVDTGLSNDVAYAYAVTAVDAQGLESARSAERVATPKLKVDATVGAGGYATLQEALAAATGTGEWVVKVLPGTYGGNTTISRSNVTVLGGGATAAETVLTSTGNTPTLTITGSSVTVRGLTVQNTSTASNSPAVSMTGDKVLLRGVALIGSDRTVWADVPTAGATSKQMIEGSTIQGANNVVLGRASLVIHDTVITATKTSGLLLVPSTTANGGRGFLVIGSTVQPASGVVDVRLGGPYTQGTTTAANAPQAVIRDTVLGSGIKSNPWMDFNGAKWTDARFGEYANTGAGAAVNASRPQLSPAESVDATVAKWLGAPTWYPAVADPAVPSDIAAPEQPTDLAGNPGDTSATLTWTAPAAADLAGYRLYRALGTSVTPGPATLVASLGAVSSFTDSGLVNNSTYTYALRAIDSAGNLSTAATVSVRPVDTAPPAAPTGLVATGGDGKVLLAWTANTEGDLAGYDVYRDGVKVNTALLTAASFTDTGLTNGTSYSYVVRAVDRTGLASSDATASATPKVGDAVPPATPTQVATVLGKGSVTVTWTAVGDGDLAGYDVLRDGTKIGSVPAGTTSYTDTTVAVGTTYSYAVVATDTASNVSGVSSAVSATPIKVDVVVAADGSGDATTVADGIAKLADNADYTAQGFRTVLVKPGTYSGYVSSGNRYGVRVVGATSNAADTVLTAPAGATATLTISGKDWQFRNLSIVSSGGAAGAQATAVQVKAGDKQVFDNVRMLGDKQTLLVSTANTTTFSRVYVTNSFIEGGADMILGRAVTVIDRSTIHVLNRPGASLTDSSIDASSKYGFLITDSTIQTDGNPDSIYLGRPYSTQGKAQVVVRDTVLGGAIRNSRPWNDWDSVTQWTAGRFAEYRNSGAGATIVDVTTRPQLSDTDAAEYTAQKYLAGTDGWNPTGR